MKELINKLSDAFQKYKDSENLTEIEKHRISTENANRTNPIMVLAMFLVGALILKKLF